MKEYYEFLYRLRASGKSTRFALQHWKNGRFREQLIPCLMAGYIEICGKSGFDEDVFQITDLGLRYLEEE